MSIELVQIEYNGANRDFSSSEGLEDLWSYLNSLQTPYRDKYYENLSIISVVVSAAVHHKPYIVVPMTEDTDMTVHFTYS